MGEKGMSRGVAVGSMCVGVLALLCALASLAWMLVSHLEEEEGGRGDVLQRLEDLEAKHQLLKGENGARIGRQLQRPEFCSLRLDPGPCRSEVYRWYFLPKESDCLSFPWGGCAGNDNNFLSLAQCRAACLVPLDQPRAPHLDPPRSPHLDKSAHVQRDKSGSYRDPAVPQRTDTFNRSSCYKQPEAGQCRDRLTRFYYDHGECKSFEYGGCAGNLNNFRSVGECRRKCLSVEDIRPGDGTRHRPAPTVDTCNLPKDGGNCEDSADGEDSVEKFYWDREAGSCVKFTYSGCGGNSNNFISRAKCRKRCERKEV